jgi:hypothetical protein
MRVGAILRGVITMWPFFWLNLVLAVVTIGVLVWAVRRIERRSAAAIEQLAVSLREELRTSIRTELTRPIPPADEWTPAKNARRCELIDREIDEVITPEEAGELAALQGEARQYVNRVAPRPLPELRALHEQLLEKAAKAGKA